MVWFIGALAIAVLVAASFAAVGRFGELPDPVVDTYAPTLPGGPLEAAALSDVRFGREVRGYDRAAVRAFLADAAAGRVTAPDATTRVVFPVALGGYAMDQVDAALARLRLPAGGPSDATTTNPPGRDGSVVLEPTPVADAGPCGGE